MIPEFLGILLKKKSYIKLELNFTLTTIKNLWIIIYVFLKAYLGKYVSKNEECVVFHQNDIRIAFNLLVCQSVSFKKFFNWIYYF